jgi:hypothetical protein
MPTEAVRLILKKAEELAARYSPRWRHGFDALKIDGVSKSEEPDGSVASVTFTRHALLSLFENSYPTSLAELVNYATRVAAERKLEHSPSHGPLQIEFGFSRKSRKP